MPNGRSIALGHAPCVVPSSVRKHPPDPIDGRGAGTFEARGIFGQHIYVNPAENLVVAAWGSLPKPTGKATIVDHDFFAAVAAALRAA